MRDTSKPAKPSLLSWRALTLIEVGVLLGIVVAWLAVHR